MLKAKLVVVGGDAKSGEVNLKLPTVIGRGKEAGLTVPHALVSRRHSEIFERDGKLVVRDLGSLNGTFINNTRIEDEKVLEPNQLLTLGNITFRAVYEVQHPALRSSDPETVSFQAAETETTETLATPTTEATVSTPMPVLDTSAPEMPNEPPASDQPRFQAVPEEPTVATPPQPAPGEPQAASGPVQETPVLAEVVAEAAAESSKDVELDSPAKVEPVAAEDAPKLSPSTAGSDVLVIDPERSQVESFSASGIDGLVVDDQKISFVSGIDLGDSLSSKPQVEESVEIDLGQQRPAPAAIDEQALGSFVKKLPR